MKLYSQILLIVFLLFLVSCSAENQSGTDINYRQGIGELEIIAPPQQSTFYEGRDFYMPFQLKNGAAYDLKNVIANIIVDESFVDIQSNEHRIRGDTPTGEIPGLSVFHPEPEIIDIPFEGEIRFLQSGADFHDLNYRIHAKYSSTVSFNPTICIGSLAFEIDDGGCKVPEVVQSFSGQGAPIAITKMDQLTYGHDFPKVELRLKVVNRGSGDVRQMRLTSNTRLGNDPLNCIFVDTDVLDGKTITFKEKNVKETDILCLKELNTRVSYLTPLLIELEYDYELTAQQKIKILKTGVREAGFN
jgi:hypothetical protein